MNESGTLIGQVMYSNSNSAPRSDLTTIPVKYRGTVDQLRLCKEGGCQARDSNRLLKRALVILLRLDRP